jgi:hypothetical protein
MYALHVLIVVNLVKYDKTVFWNVPFLYLHCLYEADPSCIVEDHDNLNMGILPLQAVY